MKGKLMIKSLERELKKFGSTTFIGMKDQYFNFKDNYVIKKNENSSKFLKVDEDCVLINNSQMFEYCEFLETYNLKNEEFLNTFQDKIDFKFINPKVKRDVITKQIITFLDLNLNHDGLSHRSSNWYNSMFESKDSIHTIDNLGEIVFSPENKKKFFSEFYKNNTVFNTIKPNNLENKLKLIKGLGLFDDLEELTNNLEDYYSSYSLDLVYKIINENEKFYKIIFGLVVPERLSKDKESFFKTNHYYIHKNSFQKLYLNILRKKILLKKFNETLHLSTLNDVIKEKIIWRTNKGSLYTSNLTEEEYTFFTNSIIPLLKKRKKYSWKELHDIFIKFKDFYSTYNSADSYVPAAPDTSKFTACKSGSVKFEKDFTMGETYYRSGTYFKYGLKIGSNHIYGNPSRLLNYVLNYIKIYSYFPKYSNGESIHIKAEGGTSWSAVGIG